MTDFDPQETQQAQPAGVRRPPPPGEESAGPALTYLIEQTRMTQEALALLTQRARKDAELRQVTVRGQVQLDGNGDGVMELYEVPQGYIGHMTLLCVDDPQNSLINTAADAGMALYGLEQSGIISVAALRAAGGAQLDHIVFSGGSSAPRPFTFTYGDIHSAPSIRGPSTFYLLMQSDDYFPTNGIIYARGHVVLERFD